jgi:hypothetical protein
MASNLFYLNFFMHLFKALTILILSLNVCLGLTWSACQIPTAIFLVFQTGASTFSSGSSSIALLRQSGPCSSPTTSHKSGSAGNQIQAS